MKFGYCLAVGVMAAALHAADPGTPNGTGAPTSMVVTVRSGDLAPGDLAVQQGKTPVRVMGLERLAGDRAGMQLFVLLDDSTRSASLGIHLPALKTFLGSLPDTTQVAVGYMRNGTFALAQPFTTNHQKAADSLRLPEAVPGGNGSPYFALSDLVNHWPSKEATGRRTVLMLTDGVDRYYDNAEVDDPYVDAAIHSALKQGVMVYSIYLWGAGRYGRGAWVTNFAQSRMNLVSQETGGHAYFEVFTDPVTISLFLKDLRERFESQYRLTLEQARERGLQRVKVHTETPGLKVEGPTYVYFR